MLAFSTPTRPYLGRGHVACCLRRCGLVARSLSLATIYMMNAIFGGAFVAQIANASKSAASAPPLAREAKSRPGNRVERYPRVSGIREITVFPNRNSTRKRAAEKSGSSRRPLGRRTFRTFAASQMICRFPDDSLVDCRLAAMRRPARPGFRRKGSHIVLPDTCQ